MNWINLYKTHINPDVTPFEIYQMASSFNLTHWVPHPDPCMSVAEEFMHRQRLYRAEQWILKNSKLKPIESMEATEARKIAEDFKSSKFAKKVEEIEGYIKNSAMQGKFETWVSDVDKEVITYFVKKGYGFKKDTDPKETGDSYKITW